MDTNVLQQMVQLMQNQGKGHLDPGIMGIVVLVIAAVAPTLASIAAYFNAASSKKVATETAEEVKNIHIAVNSERTAMLEKVQQMTEKVLAVSKENETLKEKVRGVETAAVLASATKAMAATPVGSGEAIAAIKGTTDAVKEMTEIVATEETIASLAKRLKVLEAK